MADHAIATPDPEQPRKGLQRFNSLKELAGTPVARQMLALVAVAAAMAIGVAVVLWSRSPRYGLLYSGLGDKDAAAVTQALDASHTPYELGPDGSSIRVPAADMAAIRLRLAGAGLPQGTAASGATAGADSPFGMSDMAERAHYQQLLENDLGHTIEAVQSVQSARVHLALAKPSAFIRDNRPASASVLVTLYPGRRLDPNQVAAIVHLVSSSVSDLDAAQVSVVDQHGQLLTASDPTSAASINDERLQMASRMEDTYAQRIEALLTPLVGAGKVHAQVYTDLDFSQSEKASETFDGDHAALRSEQTHSETRGGNAPGAVPGALSNQPPVMAAQPTAAKPGAGGPASPSTATATAATGGDSSQSATRNYELGRTISHVTNPAGRLARLTVAVVVDNKTVTDAKGQSKSVPFTSDELSRLTELAKNAVGFKADRGDSVSVVNQPFTQTPAPVDVPTPLWQRPGILDLAKQGLGFLAALALLLGVLRPLVKHLLRGPQVEALPAPATTTTERLVAAAAKASIEEERNEKESDLASGRLGGPRHKAYEKKMEAIKKLTEENPQQVAQVVQQWVSDRGQQS